jgi:hypothetical protein
MKRRVSNELRTEAESPLLKSVIGKRLVKTDREDLTCDVVICEG